MSHFRTRSASPWDNWCWMLGGLAAVLCVTLVQTVAAPHTSDAGFGTILVAAPGETPTASPELLDASSCFACHQFEPSMTHPVNIRPSMPTPASLPLQNGRITCVTCHDASPEHGSTRKSVGLRGGGTNLCVQCHQNAIPGTKSIHTVSTGRAHLVAEMPFGSRRVVTGLDPESRACLGCHDGAMGADVGGHQVRVGDSDAQAEHPVGVPMRSTDRTKRGDFKLASVVDKRVRLFGGVIGCGSCHSTYSREASQLVTSNQNSKLCLTCHTQ